MAQSRRGILSNGLSLAGLAAFAPGALAQQAPAVPPAGAPGRGGPPQPPVVERFDPALDALIDATAKVERIVDQGFQWCEGPVWIGGADGYLLCSDPRQNIIFQWTPKGGLQPWLKPSGLQTPVDPVIYREAGTNGLMLGRGGIVAADSGTRAIVRIDIATKQRTVLADRFEGKRFNSPNDVCLSPTTGAIYFTDPPYGLINKATPEQRGQYISPAREMDYMGVFKLAPDNTVSLIGKYQMPNGVGISPDGRTLYNTDGATGWLAHTLDAQGNSVSQRPFIDRAAENFTNPRASGDGLKVDAMGNVWLSGDGGIGIFNPQGHRIGRVRISGSAPNCEFGADGHLYIAGGTGIYRVPAKARKLMAKF
jgi:gluconolactonase